jgi:polar amino acid transport system substrate-binding protein/glutamate/aspartate transport system substrate-binding protein
MRLALRVAAAVVTAWLIPSGTMAGVLDRARETGEIRFGYRADAVPFSFADSAGLPAGYSVELCESVLEATRAATGRADLRVAWRLLGAEDRFDALARGEVDLVCSADTVTLGRRERAAFSLPVFVSGATLLYRADGPSAFEALAGQKVGARAGTTTEDQLGKGLAEAGITAEVVPVPSHEEGVRRLAAGELAAYFGDGAILLFQLLKSPERERLRLSERTLGVEVYALVLPKADDAFRLLVDRALSRLFRSREIERVFAASFGADARPSELLRALYVLSALPE